MAGRVARATYMGSHAEYVVSTPLGELFVIVPRQRRLLPQGSAVSVTLDSEGVVIVRP